MKKIIKRISLASTIVVSLALISCNNEDSQEDVSPQSEVVLKDSNATISNQERRLTRAVNDAARQVENASGAFDRTPPSQTRNYRIRGERLISRTRVQIGATTRLIDFQLGEERTLLDAINLVNRHIDVLENQRDRLPSNNTLELTRNARERRGFIARRATLTQERNAIRRRINANALSREELRSGIRSIEALLRFS